MGWLPFAQSTSWLGLRIVLNASQKGKGLWLLAINLVIVFLSMSMGLDLDCCVPYPVLPPKEFHVFCGSGILESLVLVVMVKSEMVLLEGCEYQQS